jgi:diketogulonate reductase-like aldo/keto reductase
LPVNRANDGLRLCLYHERGRTILYRPCSLIAALAHARIGSSQGGESRNGHSEELIGRVIAGQRERIFLVSKVLPTHVTGNGMARACEASLARLGTDHLDLYLLHWRNEIADLSGVVKSFEDLRTAEKIRAWGVSNFAARDMDDLFHTPQGDRCATNQVPYSTGDRGIERDLLPWCEQHGMPIMAYSPLGGPGALTVKRILFCLNDF